MDIIKNEKEWIEATQHQAFTDIVVEASTEMMKCLDRVITKAVGFDNSLRDDETEVQNELNYTRDILAKISKMLHTEKAKNDQLESQVNVRIL